MSDRARAGGPGGAAAFWPATSLNCEFQIIARVAGGIFAIGGATGAAGNTGHKRAGG